MNCWVWAEVSAVHDSLADAFLIEGTQRIFGVMGDANLLWLGSMEARGIAFHQARHEGGAIAMADGFARASGAVGIGVVTSGPGLTHSATSLTVAARHGTPIVVYVGDSPRGHHELGGIQEIDQRAIAESIGTVFIPLRTASTVAEDVQRAFHVARTSSTPVVLNVASDLSEMEADGPSYVSSLDLLPASGPVRPAMEDVAAACIEIDRAERPVVVIGKVDSEDIPEVLNLANSTGSLIATTLDGMGQADGHAFSIGLIGPFAHPVAEGLCRDADLVLGVGCGLDRFPTAIAASFPDARVIGIGQGAIRLGHVRAVDRLLRGSVQASVQAMVKHLDGSQRVGYRTPDVRDRIATDERLEDLALATYEDEAGRVDPRRAMLALDKGLPTSAHVVIGAAHFWSWPNMFLTRAAGRRFYHTHDFGAIGQALPTAVGAAAGRDELVVAIEGDGGFMQNVQEIETAVRYGLPVLFVVVDDDALGAEYHKLRARGLPTSSSLIATPDCNLLAQAFGARGVTATTVEEISETCAAYAADPEPTVLDIKVSRRVLSRSYRRTHFGQGR